MDYTMIQAENARLENYIFYSLQHKLIAGLWYKLRNRWYDDKKVNFWRYGSKLWEN